MSTVHVRRPTRAPPHVTAVHLTHMACLPPLRCTKSATELFQEFVIKTRVFCTCVSSAADFTLVNNSRAEVTGGNLSASSCDPDLRPVGRVPTNAPPVGHGCGKTPNCRVRQGVLANSIVTPPAVLEWTLAPGAPGHLGGGSPGECHYYSRMRRGSTQLTIRCATRCATVLVFPDPAPAITSNGAAGTHVACPTPCSTAQRCSGFSLSR